MPSSLAAEISLVLGAIIAGRLPTREASQWQKALEPWQSYQTKILTPQKGKNKKKKKKALSWPQVAAWPIETVLFTYPGKRNYGPGELIVWELKLLGEVADHGLFLEVILPAIEAASSTTEAPWYRPNSLWGRFDIQAVYAARGAQWEPVVSDGRLDLRYQADPTQWAEGLTFGLDSKRTFQHLTWLTPFDLARTPAEQNRLSARTIRRRDIQPEVLAQETPTLQNLLDALIARMAVLLPGKRNVPGDVWNALTADDQSALQTVIDQVYHSPVRRTTLELASSDGPGRWTGKQTFPPIPSVMIPYLEVASTLHLGQQTHLGCGTFILT